MAPALFRAGLFDHVNIGEVVVAFVVSRQRIYRIEIASRAMIRGVYLDPVGYAAQPHFTGENVGHRAVFEYHVDRRVVLDVVVTRCNLNPIDALTTYNERDNYFADIY